MAEETTSGDPYDVVLADLRAKRDQLDQAIASIEAIRSGISPTNQPLARQSVGTPTSQVAPGAFHGMSIVEAVKRLLDMRKKPLSTQEITEGIISGGVVFSTDTPANTVGSVLHRHAGGAGEIISVGRATWGLAAWYPNSSRFKKKGKTSNDAAAADVSDVSETTQALLEEVAREHSTEGASPDEVLDAWETKQQIPTSVDRRMLAAARTSLGHDLCNSEKRYLRQQLVDIVRERNT